MEILILIIYLWLGSKSIDFVKVHVLGLHYVQVTTVSNFIFGKVFFALILGWLTIPIWLILSLFGVGRK